MSYRTTQHRPFPRSSGENHQLPLALETVTRQTGVPVPTTSLVKPWPTVNRSRGARKSNDIPLAVPTAPTWHEVADRECGSGWARLARKRRAHRSTYPDSGQDCCQQHGSQNRALAQGSPFRCSRMCLTAGLEDPQEGPRLSMFAFPTACRSMSVALCRDVSNATDDLIGFLVCPPCFQGRYNTTK